MSDHLPVLKVRLFGGFSASYGEIPVSFGRNTTTKAMKLLQILLYHGDTGISRDKLLDELYGSKVVLPIDYSKVIRCTVMFSLRNMEADSINLSSASVV